MSRHPKPTAETPRIWNAQTALLLLAIATLLPLLSYQFAAGNQVEQFSLIQRALDPNFARGDFYIDSASQFGPRFYYVQTIAAFARILGLPAAILLLTLAANAATAAAAYATVRRCLGGSEAGGAFAALLATCNGGFALGLANYVHFDSFQPASLALPLAFWGLYLLVRGRPVRSALCLGLAAVFHPLIGVESAALFYAGFGAWALTAGGSLRARFAALAAPVTSGLVFSVIIAIFWIFPNNTPESIPDSEFFAILPSFRAPHHYLGASFPRGHYLSFALFAASAGALAWAQLKAAAYKRETLILLYSAAGAIALCAASLYFVDIAHHRVWATAQVFRTLNIVKWVGYVLMGCAAGAWIRERTALSLVSVFAMLIPSGQAQPRAAAAGIAGMLAARRLKLSRAAQLGVASAVFLYALYALWALGDDRETVRTLLAAMCLGAIYGFSSAPRLIHRALAGAIAAVALIGAIANGQYGWIDREEIRPTFSFNDLRGEEMAAAQWAGVHSEPGTIFITPPNFEAFRSVSGRAVIVDFTSVPFGDSALRTWRDRMATAYGPLEGQGFAALDAMIAAYRGMTPERLRALGARYGARYAVLYAETPWPDAPLYENASFKIVRISGSRDS